MGRRDLASQPDMLGVAVSRYLSAAEFQRGLPGLTAEFVVTSPGPFEARTTSVALPHTLLVQPTENLPRVAHLALPSSHLVISFPLTPQPPILWNGVVVGPGTLMIHAPGERLHHRTGGTSSWGFLAVDREALTRQGAAVLRKPAHLPNEGSALRPAPRDGVEFLRLQTRAMDFAEKQPGRAGVPEVARSLEQDLLYAFLCCLRGGKYEPPSPACRRDAAIVNRLATMLAEAPGRRPALADLAAGAGTSVHLLNVSCRAVLGVGPVHYMRLYRLNRIRAVLVEAEPGMVRIVDLARQFGFTDAGRFAAAYRAAFGELPSATISRP